MCIVYKMNVVVTRSPFEAARSEGDVGGNNIQYVGLYWLEINDKRKYHLFKFLIDQDANEIFYNV